MFIFIITTYYGWKYCLNSGCSIETKPDLTHRSGVRWSRDNRMTYPQTKDSHVPAYRWRHFRVSWRFRFSASCRELRTPDQSSGIDCMDRSRVWKLWGRPDDDGDDDGDETTFVCSLNPKSQTSIPRTYTIISLLSFHYCSLQPSQYLSVPSRAYTTMKTQTTTTRRRWRRRRWRQFRWRRRSWRRHKQRWRRRPQQDDEDTKKLTTKMKTTITTMKTTKITNTKMTTPQETIMTKTTKSMMKTTTRQRWRRRWWNKIYSSTSLEPPDLLDAPEEWLRGLEIRD